MGYRIIFTKQAQKDAKKIEECGLDKKAKQILKIMSENPFQSPPPYKKLSGSLEKFFSRRINIKHRMVYEVLENKKIIKILRMWTHYE